MEKQIHWGSRRREESGSSSGWGGSRVGRGGERDGELYSALRGKEQRWRWREGVGGGERKSTGGKEKEVGSRDELKHPVPG